MARTIPTYNIYIDWDNDGGLDFGNFELSTDGWEVDSAAGTTTAALSAVRSHLDDQCLLITWNNVANPKVEKVMTGLVVGRAYTYDAWVFVPTGNTAVRLSSPDTANNGTASATTNAWTQISVTFTATAASHTLNINVNGTPTNGHQVYLDQAMVRGPGEDVSARALGVSTPINLKYGRDQARSIAAIQPGETSFELNNRSKDYSPDNASSPLFGYLGPGKPVLIRATFATTVKSYDLFRGFLDDYVINPKIDSRSVTMSCTDILGKLADGDISTLLYPSLQTGEAIGIVLDSIGWPTEKRDLDTGATTATWWFEEGTSGLEAIAKLAASEGPPAFAFVSAAGNFVFRDRHHRLLRTASTSSQATFSDVTNEPIFTDFSYDIGWRDIINDISVNIDEREPTERQVVWSTEDIIQVASGEVLNIPVVSDNPFWQAFDPVADLDYVIVSGSATVALSRYSGQSTSVIITASSATVIKGMAVEATPVPVARTYQLNLQDASSIKNHGLKSLSDVALPWCNRNDASAVAQVILGLRAERLPIVTIQVPNRNDTCTTQILSRDLSDRITIVEAQTVQNNAFYIEQGEHSIQLVGWDHEATWGCERALSQPSPLFTFDLTGSGFNDGKFGIDGFSEATSVFKLDTSLLDTGLLGY